MSTHTHLKNFFPLISPLSKLLYTLPLALSLMGLYSSSAIASEDQPLIINDKLQSYSREMDLERGEENKRSFAEIRTSIEEHMESAPRENSLVDATPAEGGMNQVTRAFEYALEEDFRAEIQEELNSDGVIKNSPEEYQTFLLNQGYEAATKGPLSTLLAQLVDKQKKLKEQIDPKNELLREAIAALERAQNQTNLIRKFKVALGLITPLAFIVGGGAVGIAWYIWGR